MSTHPDVLIIDDEADFATIVKEVASSVSLEATVADGAEDFRAQFQSRLPTVVVMDLFMPGVNGFELAKWIGEIMRSNDKRCRLVLVSGFGDHHLRMCRTVAALAGIEDVVALKKPVEIVSLANALKV